MTLTTPYCSTITITSLARFMAKCEGKVVPDGEFGSDVEGSKPLIIDVGMVEGKMKESLVLCRNRLGDDVTIFYDLFFDSICETAGSMANMHIYISKPIGTILKIIASDCTKAMLIPSVGQRKIIMHIVRSNKSPIKSDS